MDKSQIDVRNFDLVFVDTELTGLDANHEIVELGFIKVEKGTLNVVVEKSIRIRPTRLPEANPESLAISGYNEADWVSAVDLKTAMTEFLQYTDGAMLVGHNLPMDWFFIKKSLYECGLQPNFYYKGLDTFTLAWTKLKDASTIKRYSLSELAPHFGIDMGTQHRALDDARTTYRVFSKLVEL
jgi:DNA polymerase III epsilon subunit-like protein